ncbi:MAG: hypothetical protein R3C44_04750 [Chloroflexota bacterium]
MPIAVIRFRIASSHDELKSEYSEEDLVDTWLDVDGRHIANGYQRGDQNWLVFPHLAEYYFELQSEWVTASDNGRGHLGEIRSTYYRSVLPFVLQTQGYLALHASSVVANGRVLTFSAPSGVGKSTLAQAFTRQGHAMWSDDSAIIAPVADRAEVLSLPFHPRIAKISPAWVDLTENVVDLRSIREDFSPEEALRLPLHAVLMLERGEKRTQSPADLGMLRLEPNEAITALLSQAYVFFPSQSSAQQDSLA